MATPNQPAHALVNDVMLGTRQVRLRIWDDLYEHAPLRGSNRVVPGVAGRRRKRKWDDEHPVTLTCGVNTRYDEDGAPVLARPSLMRFFADFDGALGVGLVQVPFEFHDETGEVWIGEAQALGVRNVLTHVPWLADFQVSLILPPHLELVEESS